MGISKFKDHVHTKAKGYHSKTPGLSKIPFPAIAIIIGIALVNALVWVAVGIVLPYLSPQYPNPGVLQRCGEWCCVDPNLSIVIITSIVVAATAAAISSKFGTSSRVGGIIGTSVSAAVLILLGVVNVYILWKLVRQLRGYRNGEVEEGQSVLQGYGFMFGVLRRLFRLIDR
ncbi:MAG: hypothetical protein Q9213_001583 [Squamulea squamosa]